MNREAVSRFFWNFFISVMISLTCIAAFMLVQFAAIDLFKTLGNQRTGDPTVIKNFGKYCLCVLTMCILPAVLEELVFRLLLFKYILLKWIPQPNFKYWTLAAILISSIAFAVYHWSFEQLVYQFFLGVIFANVFLRTGKIWFPIIVHFVNNFFIITYTFIAGNDYMPYSWDVYTIITAILLVIIGTVSIIGLVRLLRKEDYARQQQS